VDWQTRHIAHISSVNFRRSEMAPHKTFRTPTPITDSHDVTLAHKCLEISEILASKGVPFKFSVKQGDFNFFLSTMALENQSTKVKEKKKSPSAIKRNSARREAFLKTKITNSSSEPSQSAERPAENPTEKPAEKQNEKPAGKPAEKVVDRPAAAAKHEDQQKAATVVRVTNTFKCQKCIEVSTTMVKLKKHIHSEHGINSATPADLNQLMASCESCSGIVHKATFLKNHKCDLGP
jgi:hypothetical protein